MSAELRIVSVLVALAFVAIIFELVRRKRLKDSYALTWFFTGFASLVAALFSGWLDTLAHLLGFSLTSNAIIVFFIFLLLVLLLGMSVAITRLSALVQTLVQEVGLLKNRLDEKERGGRGDV